MYFRKDSNFLADSLHYVIKWLTVQFAWIKDNQHLFNSCDCNNIHNSIIVIIFAPCSLITKG